MDTSTLLLAGDVMTGRGIDQVMAHPAPPDLHEAWVHDARAYVHMAEHVHGPIPAPVSPRYIWGEALEEIGRSAPDACVVNLETAVTASGQPWPGKGVHYRMHPANLGCLKAAHVDVCALANNHLLDWGRDALVETLLSLARAGLRTAGAGANLARACAPAVLPLNAGQRLLVYSWAAPDCGVPDEWDATPQRPGIALLKDLSAAGLEQIADAVNAHRREGDLVLLSIHWGANWVADVPRAHRRFAHDVVDMDLADIVHGHSSHHPLPFEVHHGKLILYGCGDLVNDYEGIEPHADHPMDIACLYFATLSQASGRLVRLRLVPLQRRAFRLWRADPAARASIRHALRLKENGLAQHLHWRPDGHWVFEAPAAMQRAVVREPQRA
jgi:poly-gamma-glutamate synthesis protein (capsule biosynthesis protein)